MEDFAERVAVSGKWCWCLPDLQAGPWRRRSTIRLRSLDLTAHLPACKRNTQQISGICGLKFT